MSEQPNLQTNRLMLRPFELSDAPIVQALAGAREIADTTLAIPHPIPMGPRWPGLLPIHQPGKLGQGCRTRSPFKIQEN